MKNRIIIMIALTSLLWSCNQDSEDPRPDFISVEDAKSTMGDMNTNLQHDLIEMLSTKGGTAISDLTNLMSGAGANFRAIKGNSLSKIEGVIRDFDSIFSPFDKTSDNPEEDDFDFNDSIGVYVWDFELEDFVKTDEVVDNIQIYFPTEGSSSNNAIFKWLEFEQAEIDGEQAPTVLTAQLYVDDQLEVAFTLDVDYSFLGFVESADVTLFVAPFELRFSYNHFSTNLDLLTVLSRDEAVIFRSNVIGMFKEGSMLEVSELQINFNYGAVFFIAIVDLEGLMEAVSGDDINDFIDAKFYDDQYHVYDGSTFLGELVLLPDADAEELVAYIRYSDGSTELLSDAFTSLAGQVGVLIEGGENI